MSDLRNATDADLRAEMERRKLQASIPTPEPITDPNWIPLFKLCADYIGQLDEQGWVDDDLEKYIFEEAMNAVYGKDVFKFVNSRRR